MVECEIGDRSEYGWLKNLHYSLINFRRYPKPTTRISIQFFSLSGIIKEKKIINIYYSWQFMPL